MRRTWVAVALVAATLIWPADSFAQVEGGDLLVVSRARILSETRAASALREHETEMRAELRAWLDARKAELAAEEQALTELRAELPKEQFETRTEAFEHRVREIRRQSQRAEAQLQSIYREARKTLITELYPILIEVLTRRNGSVIIDADQILIAIPQADVTDEVIALYDDRVAPLELPSEDFLDLPAAEAQATDTAPAEN